MDSLEERAKKFEEEVKPLLDKYELALWAGLQSNNESIVAVPMYKDTRIPPVPPEDATVTETSEPVAVESSEPTAVEIPSDTATSTN